MKRLKGFCEVLKIPSENMMYYYQTLLKAGCSHCAVLPKRDRFKAYLCIKKL